MLSRSILYVGGKRFFIIHPTDLKKKSEWVCFFLKLVTCFEQMEKHTIAHILKRCY